MSKAIAIAGAGTGAATITVGSYYLAGNGKTKVNASEEEGKTPEVPAINKLEEFKKSKGGNCTNALFGSEGIDFSSASSSNVLPSEPKFFDNATSTTKTKSCLIIDWEKKTNSEKNKWSGTFAWTWTFVNDKKGFINFNIATTSNNQLKLTGGFYLLIQTENKWEIKNHKEITEEKTMDTATFKSKFPKASANLPGSTKPYWGFVSGEDDLNNICNDNSCSLATTESTEKPNHFEWIWDQSNNKKLSEWSEINGWWEYMYDNTPFDLSKNIENFTGAWTAKSST